MFLAADQANKNTHVPYWWIIGSLAAGLALIIVVVFLFAFLRSSGCFRGSQGSQAKDSDGKISHKFHILRNTSFCCASGRSICCKSGDWNHPNAESSNRQMNIPTGLNIRLTGFCLYINDQKYIINIFLHIIMKITLFS